MYSLTQNKEHTHVDLYTKNTHTVCAHTHTHTHTHQTGRCMHWHLNMSSSTVLLPILKVALEYRLLNQQIYQLPITNRCCFCSIWVDQRESSMACLPSIPKNVLRKGECELFEMMWKCINTINTKRNDTSFIAVEIFIVNIGFIFSKTHKSEDTFCSLLNGCFYSVVC